MKPSDIAKLAAQVTAGSISYDIARSYLSHDDHISMLDNLIAGGAGLIGGGIAGEVMDKSGLSDLIDDTLGSIF